MKNPVKSVFNLIEIFRKGVKTIKPVFIDDEHCETASLHDYYCDREQEHA